MVSELVVALREFSPMPRSWALLLLMALFSLTLNFNEYIIYTGESKLAKTHFIFPFKSWAITSFLCIEEYLRCSLNL